MNPKTCLVYAVAAGRVLLLGACSEKPKEPAAKGAEPAAAAYIPEPQGESTNLVWHLPPAEKR